MLCLLASSGALRCRHIGCGRSLDYGQSMIELPSWEIEQRWNGYYVQHPEREVFTESIDGAIHIATGIGGKGMSTGPGFARHNVEALLG